MSQTLTLPISEQEVFPRKRWNVRECRFLTESGLLEPGKYELIEGDIVTKVGQNPPHVLVISLVLRVLVTLFGFDHVQTQAPIAISDDQEPEPDIAVLTRPLRDYLQIGTPPASDARLVVEVSDSTLEGDRTVKARIYARAGIADYWVVDIANRRILVYRQPLADGYADITAHGENETISPLVFPDSLIRVGDLLP